MDNIIQFPIKEIRDKAEIERGIRSMLTRLSHVVQDTILINMNEFLNILCADIQCSITTEDLSIKRNLVAFQKSLNERNAMLIAERVKVEINRCKESGTL